MVVLSYRRHRLPPSRPLIQASRLGAPGTASTDCALERWREAGDKEGITARERVGGGVEAALPSLGGGFPGHPDNAALRERLASGAAAAARLLR